MINYFCKKRMKPAQEPKYTRFVVGTTKTGQTKIVKIEGEDVSKR